VRKEKSPGYRLPQAEIEEEKVRKLFSCSLSGSGEAGPRKTYSLCLASLSLRES